MRRCHSHSWWRPWAIAPWVVVCSEPRPSSWGRWRLCSPSTSASPAAHPVRRRPPRVSCRQWRSPQLKPDHVWRDCRMISEDVVEILLVEDNPNDEELTLQTFRRYHLANRIQVVRDGKEALDFIFG